MTKLTNVLLVLIILITTSCSLEKRCARIQKKCPAEIVTIVKDSIVYKEKIVINDSIIEVKLPNDTVIIREYLYVDAEGLIQLDTIIVNNGILEAIAWVNNSKLGVIAYVRDSSIFYALDSARIEITKWKEQYSDTSVNKTVKVTQNSGFAKFTIWFFWIIIAAIGGIFIYRVVKKKFLL